MKEKGKRPPIPELVGRKVNEMLVKFRLLFSHSTLWGKREKKKSSDVTSKILGHSSGVLQLNRPSVPLHILEVGHQVVVVPAHDV